MPLDFSLNRTIEIRAARATVFRFFTDPVRWARWWGAGSTIDPVVGGNVLIVYPNNARASGNVTEIVPVERFAFTFGYDDPSKPIAPGGSLVTITLAEHAGVTRLELRHDVADAATRDLHGQGWRHQLARFAHVVADDAFAAANDHLAAWIAAWNEHDAGKRRALLAPAVATEVRFRDANGDLYGFDELVDHIGAVHQFMPGLALEARGSVRRSHDTALADWAIVDGNAAVVLAGTNVVRLAADGKIADVVGIA